MFLWPNINLGVKHLASITTVLALFEVFSLFFFALFTNISTLNYFARVKRLNNKVNYTSDELSKMCTLTKGS